MNSSQVHLGYWVNWTYGSVYGATITLSQRNSSILTSAIATFITIAGARLWTLVSLMIHQLRSSRQPQDGLFWQQQVVFRNASSPAGAAWTFLQQSKHWKGHVHRHHVRTIPWALFGFTYAILLAVAALFSSEITNATGANRLLQPLACGYAVLDDSAPDTDQQHGSSQHYSSRLQQAANYARICYNSSSDSSALLGPESCNALPKSNLTWTSDRNASCPFAPGACVFSDTAAFSLTSATLDSHEDFGINAPPQDRLTLQKFATCAPLNTTGYSAIVNASDLNVDPDVYTDPDQKFYILNAGPLIIDSTTGDQQDYTIRYDTHLAISEIGYTTFAYNYIAGLGEPFWDPISSLSRVDADVSLIGIAANSMTFNTPCYDPVFGATKADTSSGETYYNPDNYVSFIVCTEQYQICNPVKSICTAMGGVDQPSDDISSLDLNPRQEATFNRIGYSMSEAGIYFQVDVQGASGLIAQRSVLNQNLEQFSLPNDQWMLEVQGWFESSLAMIQEEIQSYPTTGLNAVPAGLKVQEPGPDEGWMCYNQITRSTAGNTSSFSVLGLSLTTGIGGLIILLSFIVEPIVERIAFRSGRGKLYSRYVSWVLDSYLQLHRLVTQLSGLSEWTGTTESIPVTTKHGVKFGGLESLDKEHMWLREEAESGKRMEPSKAATSPLLAGEPSENS